MSSRRKRKRAPPRATDGEYRLPRSKRRRLQLKTSRSRLNRRPKKRKKPGLTASSPSQIPLDWTLKTQLTVSIATTSGISLFGTISPSLSDSRLLASSTRPPSAAPPSSRLRFCDTFFQSLHHFEFPSPFRDRPSARGSVSSSTHDSRSRRTVPGITPQIWSETYLSVQQKFFSGFCPYFYVLRRSATESWCCVFVSGGCGDPPQDTFALLSCGSLLTTFRSDMERHSVQWSVPERSRHSAHHERTKKRSTFRFDGVLQVHRFLNFLLQYVLQEASSTSTSTTTNTTNTTAGSSLADISILCPIPFLNGSFVSAVKDKKSTATSDFQTLTYDGLFLPHSVQRICKAFSESQFPFELRMRPHGVSRPLNVSVGVKKRGHLQGLKLFQSEIDEEVEEEEGGEEEGPGLEMGRDQQACWFQARMFGDEFRYFSENRPNSMLEAKCIIAVSLKATDANLQVLFDRKRQY